MRRRRLLDFTILCALIVALRITTAEAVSECQT
jgi:hypothetical protein